MIEDQIRDSIYEKKKKYDTCCTNRFSSRHLSPLPGMLRRRGRQHPLLHLRLAGLRLRLRERPGPQERGVRRLLRRQGQVPTCGRPRPVHAAIRVHHPAEGSLGEGGRPQKVEGGSRADGEPR